MSRYIDADTLEEKVKQYSLGYYEADEWAVPLCEISEAPSIDIVFCKECKWYKKSEAFCENGNGLWQAGDECFCNYGERSDT